MKNIILSILLLAVVSVSFYFLAKIFKNSEMEDIENIQGMIEANKDENEEKTDLEIEILKEGTGPEAKNGDKLSVHYTGLLEDGTKFDSSLDKGIPFSFVLGAGQVIKGWEKGALGMKIGEKRKLTIPPELGYGQDGVAGLIPANAVLMFEVELLEIN